MSDRLDEIRKRADASDPTLAISDRAWLLVRLEEAELDANAWKDAALELRSRFDLRMDGLEPKVAAVLARAERAEARAENAEQERDEAVHRSGLLAGALGRLLVALGAVTDSPMTGPELLMHAEAAIEHFRDGRHEALAWYADLGNYVSADSTPPAIRSDNGYRARCALGYEGHPHGT